MLSLYIYSCFKIPKNLKKTSWKISVYSELIIINTDALMKIEKWSNFTNSSYLLFTRFTGTPYTAEKQEKIHHLQQILLVQTTSNTFIQFSIAMSPAFLQMVICQT